TVTFTTVDLDGMTGNGISITNNSNPVNVNGGTIGATDDAAANDVDLDGTGGGTGAVTIAAALTKTTAGRIVEVTNRTGSASGPISFSGSLSCTSACGTSTTIGGIYLQNNNAGSGGTITFSSATKTFNTGANSAITLDNNDGHTISFTNGNLSITTTSGTGFSAINGGTVAVTGTANTISAGSGQALNVTSTNIGSADLTFRSISATAGANNGITLSSTGTGAGDGGLTITGTGSAGSGGTISGKTGSDGSTTSGTGIYLNLTRDPSFSWMQINDHQNFGIFGSDVVNFTLLNSVINGTNGTSVSGEGESAIQFQGLTGSASVMTGTIQGGSNDNFRVKNGSGVLNRLVVQNVTFNNNGASGNHSLALFGRLSATLNATIQNNTFTAYRANAVTFDGTDQAVMDLILNSNTITNSRPGPADLVNGKVSGSFNVQVSTGGTGHNVQMTYSITGNTLRNANGAALSLGKGGGTGATGSMVGTVSSNNIGNPAVDQSGSEAGPGIIADIVGGGSHNVTITNNTISQWSDQGIFISGGSSATGQGYMTAVLKGNTINQRHSVAIAGGTASDGILLNEGTTTNDNTKFCLTVGGSAAADKNTANNVGFLANGNGDIRYRQRFNTTAGITGYGGATNDTAALDTYLASTNNVNNADPNGIVVSRTGGNFSGACPAASSPNNRLGSTSNDTVAGALDAGQVAGKTGLVVAAVPGRDMDKASTTPVVAANRTSNKAGAVPPVMAAKTPLIMASRYVGRSPGLASPISVLASPRTAPIAAPAAVSSFPITLGTL
ncbi:MAG: hypothetical protein M3328_11205, partial [Chloroflexota bacterium]|nr:hypothetical protein [Chloroflexota bacterium]